jgi:hypothetical protein
MSGSRLCFFFLLRSFLDLATRTIFSNIDSSRALRPEALNSGGHIVVVKKTVRHSVALQLRHPVPPKQSKSEGRLELYATRAHPGPPKRRPPNSPPPGLTRVHQIEFPATPVRGTQVLRCGDYKSQYARYASQQQSSTHHLSASHSCHLNPHPTVFRAHHHAARCTHPWIMIMAGLRLRTCL